MAIAVNVGQGNCCKTTPIFLLLPTQVRVNHSSPSLHTLPRVFLTSGFTCAGEKFPRLLTARSLPLSALLSEGKRDDSDPALCGWVKMWKLRQHFVIFLVMPCTAFNVVTPELAEF